MSQEITIHYFQTHDGEWLCAVQEPHVHGKSAMDERLQELSKNSHHILPEEDDEHLAVLARIAIHHAMEQQGLEREFTLEALPPIVKIEVPSSEVGASLLNLFEGVTVWRKSDSQRANGSPRS